MPWKEVSLMGCREEFVLQASLEGANVSSLCERYGISRKTGYKWLRRFAESGSSGLSNRSRRPRSSPGQTEGSLEEAVVALRQAHPAWGGRKLRRRLLDLGHAKAPSASTITEILRRRSLLSEAESAAREAPRRFEHAHSNDLWQMDFKGHFSLTGVSHRCHPLTILDDHSRFAIRLCACSDERSVTVRRHLTSAFEEYGLPCRILADNGSPWSVPSCDTYTALEAWLLRLGVKMIHGRPYHPQTQGKDERFHRTIVAEVLSGRSFSDIESTQRGFDRFRTVYNCERPHEALGMEVPARRYEPSFRRFPRELPEIEYEPGDQVRKAQRGGHISYGGERVEVGKAFRGERLALRATATDGMLDVFFCSHRVGTLDCRTRPYQYSIARGRTETAEASDAEASEERSGVASGRCAPSGSPAALPWKDQGCT